MTALSIVLALLAAACSNGGITVNGPVAPTDAGGDADAAGDAVAADPTPPADAPTPDADRDSDAGSAGIAGRFSLVDTPCRFERPADVQTSCFTLQVPERWDLDDDDDAVELHVGVFETSTSDDQTVVYLEGGPGGHALDIAALSFEELWRPFVERHRLVIFDQRGTGSSLPSLQCPEVLDASLETLTEPDPDLAAEAENDALVDCIDRVTGRGADVDAYNSGQSAHDVEALRLALESAPWNVIGVSYGTRLAQTLLREHPDGVRSVVLDAVLPIDSDLARIPATAHRAFTLMFDACRNDTGCATAFPDFEDRFWALVDELDAEPITFAGLNPITAARFDVRWDGSDLIEATFSALYSRDLFVDIPLLVSQLEVGDTSGAATLTGQFVAQQEYTSVGMFWAVACFEEEPYTDADEYAAGRSGDPRFDDVFATGQSNADDFAGVCDIVGSGAADPVEDQPVDADVPALVLSGEFDPITPPEFGQDVADDLARSVHVVLPRSGHGAIGDDCGRSLILAFVAEPDVGLDQSCVDLIDPLAWAPDPSLPERPFVDILVSVPLGGDVTVRVPDNWEAVGNGVVAEDVSVLRQGALVFLTSPPGQLEVLPGLLFGQLGADPSPDGVVDAGGVTWTATTGQIPGATIDAWTATVDGEGILVVLQSPPSDRDRLLTTVIPTVLASVDPVS